MAKLELLMIVTFAVLAVSTDVDEQKKRGTDKGTNLNSITTGAQKQDYTYSIYSQNPSPPTSQSSSYQSQVSNSFYPNQGSSQYYSSSKTEADTSYQPQQQPQINLSHHPSTTQFVPLNFIPNPGFQSRYQIAPSKSNGNIQLAIVQQPTSYATAPVVPYAPSLFSSNAANSPHQSSLSIAPGHYNVPQNYQQFSGSYLNQPSTMLLFAQPNPNLYNNFLYPNPVQSFYNHYPSNTQAKYTPYTSGSSEYEKYQGPITQGVPKEDNDISQNGEYSDPSDSSSSYKSAYSASRNSYSKA